MASITACLLSVPRTAVTLEFSTKFFADFFVCCIAAWLTLINVKNGRPSGSLGHKCFGRLLKRFLAITLGNKFWRKRRRWLVRSSGTMTGFKHFGSVGWPRRWLESTHTGLSRWLQGPPRIWLAQHGDSMNCRDGRLCLYGACFNLTAVRVDGRL